MIWLEGFVESSSFHSDSTNIASPILFLFLNFRDVNMIPRIELEAHPLCVLNRLLVLVRPFVLISLSLHTPRNPEHTTIEALVVIAIGNPVIAARPRPRSSPLSPRSINRMLSGS
jgi:hypothetical protein